MCQRETPPKKERGEKIVRSAENGRSVPMITLGDNHTKLGTRTEDSRKQKRLRQTQGDRKTKRKKMKKRKSQRGEYIRKRERRKVRSERASPGECRDKNDVAP